MWYHLRTLSTLIPSMKDANDASREGKQDTDESVERLLHEYMNNREIESIVDALLIAKIVASNIPDADMRWLRRCMHMYVQG
jgi:hypothetical protein